MAHKPVYVNYPVVAWRTNGGDRWQFDEALDGIEAFRALIEASGVSVVEMRSLFERTRQKHLREAQGIEPDLLLDHGWSWDEPSRAWRAPDELILAPPGQAKLVEDVVIRFDPALWGWQPVRLKAGGKRFRFDASDIFDPFPDLVRWLEIVAEGGTGRVICNVEGWFVEFHALMATDPGRVRIVVTSQAPARDGEIRDLELDIDIDRLRFASRFYGSLRSYAESDRYVAEHWAAISLAEDLIRRGYERDPVVLADGDAAVLKETLTRFYPEYNATFRTRSGPELVWFSGWPASLLRWERSERVRHALGKPDAEFVIPADFDSWSVEERRSHVEELLATFITSWGATDLLSLRSSTLDAVLDLLRE